MKSKIRASCYCAAMLVVCNASVGATLPEVTIDDTLVFPESLSAAAPFPAPASVCNDITLAKNGAAYISDTPNGRIFRVSRGSKQLELFAQDDQLKGIDGIVFSGDGTLYANSVTTNKLWRIAIGKDGKVGAITEITPSEPLKGADGFRSISGNRP